MKSHWIQILFHPTKTIKDIVQSKPSKGIFFLSTIFGFFYLMQIAQIYAFSEKWQLYQIVLGALLLSPICGYLLLNVTSFVFYIFGKWIQGKGEFVDCRAAVAWSCTPLIINDLVWLFLLFAFGKEIFSSFPGGALLTTKATSLLLFFLLLQVTGVIWSLLLFLHTLAAVQRFSIARSLLNLILAMVFVIALMFVVYIFFLIYFFL